MNHDLKYILDGRRVVPVTDLMEWAEWFETADRRVAQTERDGIRVSTVFLGIDHRFTHGPPLVFQTMVFGGEHEDLQERYSTYDEAEEGHQRICEQVFNNKGE